MPIVGERLFVAAPLDPVEQGQGFKKIPPHVTVVGWFSFPEHQRTYLFDAMDRIFTNKDIFQKLEGGKHAMYGEKNDIPVREILNAEDGPWFALRALVKSVGQFSDDNQFVDVFSPHVSDTLERKVARREKLDISTVALFSADSEKPIKRVEAVYTLGKNQHG